MNQPPSRTEKVFAKSIDFFDGALSIELISSAVLAAAFGKLLLGGILGAVAFGVFLRFKRRKQCVGWATRPPLQWWAGRPPYRNIVLLDYLILLNKVTIAV